MILVWTIIQSDKVLIIELLAGSQPHYIITTLLSLLYVFIEEIAEMKWVFIHTFDETKFRQFQDVIWKGVNSIKCAEYN